MDIGSDTKWYVNYMCFGNNMQKYIINTFNDVLDEYIKYLNSDDNDYQNMFNVGLHCDCNTDNNVETLYDSNSETKNPANLCHGDIIQNIVESTDS